MEIKHDQFRGRKYGIALKTCNITYIVVMVLQQPKNGTAAGIFWAIQQD